MASTCPDFNRFSVILIKLQTLITDAQAHTWQWISNSIARRHSSMIESSNITGMAWIRSKYLSNCYWLSDSLNRCAADKRASVQWVCEYRARAGVFVQCNFKFMYRIVQTKIENVFLMLPFNSTVTGAQSLPFRPLFVFNKFQLLRYIIIGAKRSERRDM